MLRGRFSFILPTCLAIVLGGGWCVCPMAADAAQAPSMKCCGISATSASADVACCTTDCGDSGDRDQKHDPNQPSWTIVDCLACVFAGSTATVSLNVDSVRQPQLQPTLTGILTSTQMTVRARPAAPAAVAPTAKPAGSTLLELRCALNL